MEVTAKDNRRYVFLMYLSLFFSLVFLFLGGSECLYVFNLSVNNIVPEKFILIAGSLIYCALLCAGTVCFFKMKSSEFEAKLFSFLFLFWLAISVANIAGNFIEPLEDLTRWTNIFLFYLLCVGFGFICFLLHMFAPTRSEIARG